MNAGLRERCREFAGRTPPARLGYVGGSVAEAVLRGYADGIAPDGETLELLGIVIADSRELAATSGGAVAEYLLASAALLEEIAGEVTSPR